MKKRILLLAAVMLVQSVLACVCLAEPAQAVPELRIVSDIFGSGDTGGKTTIKHTLVTAAGPGDQTIRYSDPETGARLDYPVYNEDGTLFEVEQPPVRYTGSAVLTLAGERLDDSLIDSSGAVVRLLPGDGYVADEMLLLADRLSGEWQDGALVYTLQEGDLAFNTGDYVFTDPNSGSEWSILGGDGNGCFTFNLGVSGITYDGQPVNDAAFQVRVYIWGRTGTDVAPEITDLVPEAHLPSGVQADEGIQWRWVGDEGDFLGAPALPVLCDDRQDDFFIIWPAGTDASALTADDVSVTLASRYGEALRLRAEGEHIQYAVFSSGNETQVAVTFRHAAFTPVFTTMTIEVDGAGLTASRTYDIASVYAYMLQQGGGGLTVDGTCTAYSYYGYEGLSIANAAQATYTLSVTEGDRTFYYAETANGTGYLAEAVAQTSIGFMGEERVTLAAPEDAKVFDAMGPDDCDVQFIVNTLYVKTRLDRTQTLAVDGRDIAFTREYARGQIGSWDGVTLMPGYVFIDGFSPNQQWAWSPYYGSGWSPELGLIPDGFPYVDGPFGSYADRYAPASSGPSGGGPGGPTP
ncbi:MAG: hypothetical protein ACI4O7_05165 [Aristaeellaceae bacterium]